MVLVEAISRRSLMKSLILEDCKKNAKNHNFMVYNHVVPCNQKGAITLFCMESIIAKFLKGRPKFEN